MDPTLADGLAVPEVGARAFALARSRVDSVVTVGEELISLAILRLVEMQHGVVEGAGASPLAALLSGQLPELAGKKVVLLLCGGNIDPLVLARVIEHSLAYDGRLVQFSATISDRPGGLAELASTIAAAGASVQDIRHERIFGGPDVSRVRVSCVVETPSMLMNCSRRCAHVASRSMSGFARSRRANDANCCDSRIQRRKGHRALPSCGVG